MFGFQNCWQFSRKYIYKFQKCFQISMLPCDVKFFVLLIYHQQLSDKVAIRTWLTTRDWKFVSRQRFHCSGIFKFARWAIPVQLGCSLSSPDGPAQYSPAAVSDPGFHMPSQRSNPGFQLPSQRSLFGSAFKV